MSSQIAGKEWARRLNWLWPDIGLGTKMAALVIVGTLSLIGLFAYLGTVALQESTERTLQDRVVLAQATASHIDYALTNIEYVLSDAAARESWTDPEEIDFALERTYNRLQLYATQVFLTNDTGRVIAARSSVTSTIDLSHFAAVSNVLKGQPFAVSRYKRPLNSGASTIAAAPVRDSSQQVIGALVIAINLINPGYLNTIHSVRLGESGYIDLVDLSGTILASTRPERVDQVSNHGDNLSEMIREHRPTVSTGHSCLASPTAPASCREVLAFAGLDQAQWGVAVRQSEDEVFAATRMLQFRIFALMVICIAGALILVYLTTRSVIHPVQVLTAATRRIAAGDLDTPIETSGKDEIGSLARSLDEMRVQLKEWNRVLDARVREATAECRTALQQNTLLYAELQEKEQLRRELLHRVFSAQEEERKRISRELHDETCQILNSLAYDLDNVGEMLAHGAASPTEIQPLLENMRALAKTGRDGVSRIIFDMRPTMLDHLGLVPALRWYAETRFTDLGIRYSFRELGTSRRLSPSIETAVFRVAQEAINNIAKHSHARHADFVFEYFHDRVEVRISDDGRGFDRMGVENLADGKPGLGLVGMEERMTAVGGRFRLHTAVGEGTAILLNVPLASLASSSGTEGGSNGPDSSAGSG